MCLWSLPTFTGHVLPGNHLELSMDPPQEFKPVDYRRKLVITYDVLLSEQFRSLSPTSRDVYVIFLYKRQFANKRRGKTRNLKNNCNIQFSEYEATKKWKIPKNSFWRAIAQLKKAKIIRVAHKGYGLNHDVNLYELIGKFDGVCKW